MRINAKVKWLTAMLALALVLVLLPLGETGADEPEIEANFGFIPNSGEASVSKVDLVSFEEAARYYTAERSDPNPNAWRTSRIAMDADGNAWVLNVGADGTNLQGSVVRIQGDTEGLLVTNDDPTVPLPFGTDEAVQVLPVGLTGEMPRAIAIDGEGFIWVGFYSGGYLAQYSYDGTNLTLVATFRYGDGASNNIKFYEMKFDPDGTLWISSRNSTPSKLGTAGIFSFDGTNFKLEKSVDPYSLLIAAEGTVYATAFNNQLYIFNGSEWSQKTVGNQNRGMAFDDLGNIWIASTAGVTGGTTIYSYNIASGAPGLNYILTSGTTPVGVGKDFAGNMWAICRSDLMAQGWIEGFNPSDQTKVGAIQVGYRPYAYGDFVVEAPPVGCLEVTKSWAGEYDAADLPAYVEVKVYSDAEKTELVTTLTLEPEEWRDEVCGLTPGIYYVEEIAVEGFSTSYSPDNSIEVVADQTVAIVVTNEFDEEKCYGDETAWAYGDGYAKPNWDYAKAKNWGWTNGPLSEDTYEFPVYAGAGGNDIEKGTLVGTLYVDYDDGTVTVKYDLNKGYYLGETHLWVGNDVLPAVRRGYTNAPGQFPNSHYYGFESGETMETEWVWTGSGFEGEIWVAAHAVVWMEVECEEAEEY